MNRLEVLERLAVAVRVHRRVEMAYLSHSGSCRICDERVGMCETGDDLWAEATIKQLDVWSVLIELEGVHA